MRMRKTSVLVVLSTLLIGCSLAPMLDRPAPLAGALNGGYFATAPLDMSQEQCDQLAAGSGAKCLPYTGVGPHYELVSLSVMWGAVNNRIRVAVYDQLGRPAFNIWVRHNYGNEYERFRFTGEPVQFNLGGGSHYVGGNDPPNHILIEGLPSDEIRVGNCSCVGFAHTDWNMAFQLKDAAITPTPIIATRTPSRGPSATPVPSGACDVLPISKVRICAP